MSGAPIEAKLAVALKIFDSGQTDRGLAILRQLARAAPDHPGVHNALGALLYDVGDLDGAERALRRCLALDPEHPLAHATLGEIAVRRGHGDAARRHFSTVLASQKPALDRMKLWVRALLRGLELRERQQSPAAVTARRAERP